MNDDNDQAAAPAPTGDVKPDAAAYGRALQGFGINLLVRDVAAVCRDATATHPGSVCVDAEHGTGNCRA